MFFLKERTPPATSPLSFVAVLPAGPRPPRPSPPPRAPPARSAPPSAGGRRAPRPGSPARTEAEGAGQDARLRGLVVDADRREPGGTAQPQPPDPQQPDDEQRQVHHGERPATRQRPTRPPHQEHAQPQHRGGEPGHERRGGQLAD